MVPRIIRPYDELFFFGGFMEDLVLFLLSYLFVFFLYQIFVVARAKRSDKKGKKRKDPIEVSYLVRQYHLDLEKVNYNQLLQIIAIVSSFDIALIVSIIGVFNNYILSIVGGFLFTLIIIFLSYYLVYLFYKKKGMIDNE